MKNSLFLIISPKFCNLVKDLLTAKEDKEGNLSVAVSDVLFICRMFVASETLTRCDKVCSDPNVVEFCLYAYQRLDKYYEALEKEKQAAQKRKLPPTLARFLKKKNKSKEADELKQRQLTKARKDIEVIQVEVDSAQKTLKRSRSDLKSAEDDEELDHVIKKHKELVAKHQDELQRVEKQLKKAKQVLEELE